MRENFLTAFYFTRHRLQKQKWGKKKCTIHTDVSVPTDLCNESFVWQVKMHCRTARYKEGFYFSRQTILIFHDFRARWRMSKTKLWAITLFCHYHSDSVGKKQLSSLLGTKAALWCLPGLEEALTEHSSFGTADHKQGLVLVLNQVSNSLSRLQKEQTTLFVLRLFLRGYSLFHCLDNKLEPG